MQLKDKPSALSHDGFVRIYGGIYEHSPWIAEAAWQTKDGQNLDTVEGLHFAMNRAVDDGTQAQRLALLRAHPELACAQGELTESSQSEQAGAGLKHCTAEEFAEFQRLNAQYREQFGFPFIIAVKGLNRQDILHAFRARIRNDRDEEFATALAQVHRIARFRLEALSEDPS